jgi:beta-lactamase class A
MRRLASLIFVVATSVLGSMPADAAIADLGRLVDQRLASYRAGVGVVIIDPRNGRTLYERNPDRTVVAASLYKLGILLEAERRVEAGLLRYSDTITIQPQDITADGSFRPAGTRLTVDQALELTITYSDNGSALALRRIFGPRAVNDTLARSGIKQFHIAEGGWEDNIVSPRAVGTFFTALSRRELISPAASDRMLARLARQRVNDRLPAQLPAGTVVAHKTGNLSFVNHDAGIIYREAIPIVVVALTWNARTAAAVDLIADIAEITYANAVQPPPKVAYGLPSEPIAADAGGAILVDVRLTNVGKTGWKLGDPDPLTLIWEMRDPQGNAVAKSTGPIAIPDLPPGGSVELPVVFDVPASSGEYSVELGLADRANGALAAIGAETATVRIVSREPAPPQPALLLPQLPFEPSQIPPLREAAASDWPAFAVPAAAALATFLVGFLVAAGLNLRRRRLARREASRAARAGASAGR